MSIFRKLFGVSYQQMKAKIRYRILFLTLLPILLTLISLIFITIYWNISYTKTQLFMKVKGALAVANSLLQPIERIHHVINAVQAGRNVRIGPLGLERKNELSNLAAQFDRMLDQLQQRNAEI